jgi:hypothetical protein
MLGVLQVTISSRLGRRRLGLALGLPGALNALASYGWWLAIAAAIFVLAVVRTIESRRPPR